MCKDSCMATMNDKKTKIRVRRINELLARSAALHPDRPALHQHGRTSTYRELAAAVEKTTLDLHRRGVGPGDRVLVVGTNSIEAVTLLFGLGTLGAWPVLVSSRVAPGQLDAIIAHCDPRLALYVGAPGGSAREHALRRDAKPAAFTALEGILSEEAGTEVLPEPQPDSPENGVAAMIYTSGTTGMPKAAMLSHRNLVHIGLTQLELRRYSEIDKTYCPLPISHVGALGILMCVLAAGACMYLADRFEPAKLVAAIRDHGITVVPGLPPLYVKLLEWLADNPTIEFDTSRVRLITSSSSRLNAPVKRAVERLFEQPLQNAYGLTEATGVIFQAEAGQWRKDASVGPPIPGVSVRIIDASGNDVPLGERGEIVARGPNVFLGYYKDPAATHASFTRDGWLRSGDLGYVDESGVAFITGRSKETIKRSGYNIYPAELEAALNEHDCVSMSAVVPGRRLGDEEVVAFVQPKKDSIVQPAALLAFLQNRIAAYELPGAIHLVNRLPTLHNGKVDKMTLRQWAQDEDAHEAGMSSQMI